MLKDLRLDTLGDLHAGAVRLMVDAAIREMVRDLDDRGDDGKTRQVIITLSAERLDDGKGDVALHVEAQTRTPKYRTPGTVARLAIKEGEASLFFQDLAPDDPDQRTIDEQIDRNAE